MSVPFVRFCRGLPRGLPARLRTFRRDTAGAVAVIVALMAPVLVGAMGLGSEVGYWYLTERKLQNVADVAAYAAAQRNAAGGGAGLQALAEYLAERSGVDLADATVEVNVPPASGAFSDTAGAVEVVVIERVPRFFSGIYGMDPLDISARAVAAGQSGGTGCVLALSTTQEGAITLTGSSKFSLVGCDVVSNGPGKSIKMTGSQSITADCIQTAGTFSKVGSAKVNLTCDAIRENAGHVADPLASVPEPVPYAASPCQSGMVGSINKTLTPNAEHWSGMKSMRFCGNTKFTGSGKLRLDPGLYIFEGDLEFTGSIDVIGHGVMIYMAKGAKLKLTGSGDIVLTPPTSGPYAGISIFASRESAGVAHSLTGSSDAAIDGAIYVPTGSLTLTGSNDTASAKCVQIITDTLTVTGSGDFKMKCTESPGPRISIGGEIALLE
jgi:hypothetical protein